MPCDQVVKFNVKFDLERQGNMDRYLKAAEALKWTVYGKMENGFSFEYKRGRVARFYDGEMNISIEDAHIADKLKVEYSKLAVMEKAKKSKWNVKIVGNKFTMTKKRW